MKRSMRWVISGLAVLGFAHGALADDLDYLRGSDVFAPGPATYSNLSGFYFGATGGGGLADAGFGNRPLSLLSSTLATTPLPNAILLSPSVPPLSLSPDNASFASFGGFAGYNTQRENAIVGLEVKYHRTSLRASAAASAPTFTIPGSGGVSFFNVDASTSSQIHLTDYATIRGRAGWALGTFLPYATLGMAIGRADITNAARVHFVAVDSFGAVLGSVDVPTTEIQSGHLAFGFAAGVGVDWMVMSCLFLRAEYEFVDFTNFGDRSHFPNTTQVVQRSLSLNTVRAGLGYKF